MSLLHQQRLEEHLLILDVPQRAVRLECSSICVKWMCAHHLFYRFFGVFLLFLLFSAWQLGILGVFYMISVRFGAGVLLKSDKGTTNLRRVQPAGSDATARRKIENSSGKRLTKRKSVLYFISPAWFGDDFERCGSDHWESPWADGELRRRGSVLLKGVRGINFRKFLKRALTNTKSMLY